MLILKPWSVTTILLIIAVLPCLAQMRVATYQHGSNDRIANIWPVSELIAETLGKPLTVASYPTVGELVKAIREDIVDIAFINTFGYLMLSADSASYAMEPLVMWQPLVVEPEIPLGPVLVNNRLSTAKRQQIADIFKELHQIHPEAYEAVKSGWSKAHNAVSYDYVPTDYDERIQQQFGKENHLILMYILKAFLDEVCI